MLSASAIKKAISQQADELFAGSMHKLKNCTIGEPVPMKDDKEVQQYWFTPFISKNKIAGSCIQNLDGKIVLRGLVTPNAAWEDKIDAAFLVAPPEKILAEVERNYPGSTIFSAYFSYDKIPQKWAWQIKMKNTAGSNPVIYASHNGWYEKRMADDTGREG